MEEFLLFCLFFQEDCSPVSQVVLLGILGPLEVSNAKWTWCDLTHFWCDVMRFMSRCLGEHAFKWSFDNPSQGMWRILEGSTLVKFWNFRTNFAINHRNSPFVFLMIFCCLTPYFTAKTPRPRFCCCFWVLGAKSTMDNEVTLIGLRVPSGTRRDTLKGTSGKLWPRQSFGLSAFPVIFTFLD